MDKVVFPWAQNSVVRWVMSKEPHTNAWALDQLAEKYGVKIWFFRTRLYVRYGGVGESRVVPTLVLGSAATVVSWVESVLNNICDGSRV